MMALRSSFVVDLISGRRKGFPYNLARGIFALISVPYRLTMALRNHYYNLFGFSRRRLNCPVFAVGNITVGGTGKTPMSARIAKILQERQRHVAILMRGYKASTIQFDAEGSRNALREWHMQSDEAMVLKRRCPHANIVLDANRLAGAQRALSDHADAIVLDDAFQHRRIDRDLDIVLIDATAPFGYGHMLPRGLLREPIKSLRRADLLILTRSDQIDESDKRLLLARINQESGGKPVIQAVHRIIGFMELKGRPVTGPDPKAMRAVVFAGIANFSSFRQCIESLEVRILAAYEYPDHHDYTQEEVDGLKSVAETLEANVILTTEKDAVKLIGRWGDEGCRLLVLDLEIELIDPGDRILSQAIDEVLEKYASPKPSEKPNPRLYTTEPT